MNDKIHNFWISNAVVGRIKKVFYRLLRRRYGFREWHVSPINERAYAIFVVKTVNALIRDGKIREGSIVEVGCGLGEIIGNIYGVGVYKETIGYDIQKEIVPAAKLVHSKCKFIYGSFQDIRNEKIGCLIFVNFAHCIEATELCKLVQPVLTENKVQYVVMDSVYGEGYQYKHECKTIVGYDYRLIKSRVFKASGNGKRRVEVFCRKEN